MPGYAISTDVSAAELTRRVRNQLHSRPELRHITVRAEDGRVELNGRVPSYYLKQLCISGSRRVAGVRELIDSIEVHFKVA